MLGRPAYGADADADACAYAAHDPPASKAHNTVLGEDETAEIVLQRGIMGYGFTFSTNTDTYLQGINHYVSSVDAGGAAFHAGLRAGHRLINLNGRNLTNLSHEVVINLIASFVGDIQGFTLTIKGANPLILSSLRRKHRTLPLGPGGQHTPLARDALSGINADETRERALADFKKAGTIVETIVDPSEGLLGPIAWHNLKPAIDKFKKNFKVPNWAPDFDVAKDGREVQDLGQLDTRAPRVCVCICVCLNPAFAKGVRARGGAPPFTRAKKVGPPLPPVSSREPGLGAELWLSAHHACLC